MVAALDEWRLQKTSGFIMKFFSAVALCTVLAIFCLVLAPLGSELTNALKWSYLTGVPSDLGRTGGVGPVVKSTLVLLIMSIFMTVVLGLPVAIRLAESTNIFLRSMVDILAGTPSIVFGLLGHALFVQFMELGYSLLSGALTLTCMMLPYFVRVAEDALREVPRRFRLVSASLGLSSHRYFFRVVLPLVKQALLTGIILSWMRAAAETAALLFTAGYSLRSIQGLGILESGRPLSVHIFELSMNIANADDMAFRGAALLLMISFAFLILLRLPGAILKGKSLLTDGLVDKGKVPNEQ